MSDLQCPATLLIARHADAQHAQGNLTPDEGGALTDNGRAQVRNFVEQVRGRRIAEVYSSTMPLAARSAEWASSELGVQHIVVKGLQEFSFGEREGGSYEDLWARRIFDAWLHGDLAAISPGAENAHAVVKRFKDAVEQIADTHRGEAVLVFTHGAVISLAVPLLSMNVRADFAAQRFLPSCAAIEVQVDADGWRIVSWPSSADF